MSGRFVAPAGGIFGADVVVDAAGDVVAHVVIEPEGAMPPAGETDGTTWQAAGRANLMVVPVLLQSNPVRG